jgi:membrane protease YdiL (CAAX protease family)
MKSDVLDRPQGILCLALVTYVIWVIATFLLEGRILTLLRPEAVADRVVYTLIANILIGSLLALLVVHHAITRKIVFLKSAGFQPFKRTLIAVVFSFILGIVVLILQHPASLDPIVLLNVYAQVFTVTIAEIAVCWVVVGSITEGVLSTKGKVIALLGGILLSSILFGVYHFAHSPPFNQPTMVAFLSIIGLVTSLVYFIGRDLYATMVFHNFFGVIGVMQSLSASGLLGAYSQPLFPVIGMAIVSFVIFAGFDLLYLRKKPVTT